VWTYNTQLRFYEKNYDIKTERWLWKIKVDGVQDDQQKYEKS